MGSWDPASNTFSKPAMTAITPDNTATSDPMHVLPAHDDGLLCNGEQERQGVESQSGGPADSDCRAATPAVVSVAIRTTAGRHGVVVTP